MKKKFSTKWKESRQPRKQRKYRHNAPLHIRGKFLNIHISKDLAKKHGLKRIRARAGDKVKVMRGKFKGKEGKIEALNSKKSRVVITGIEVSKKDGSKSKPPVHASNLLIIEINLDDKKRIKKKGKDKDKDKDKKTKVLKNG
ncbi:50S ribosomal protein L24 [Candidatus Woesearchaeota archaeon]|nr:50S ribosomal protein L24 [Candidatus Woesearchaeota archaeon]